VKKKLTVNNIKLKKFRKPLVCLTAYTTPMAEILDKYCDVAMIVKERLDRIGFCNTMYYHDGLKDWCK
jgi:ketopantoate hydroxymethyltransferase